jgi:arabinosaccharide transport system substrate-binding protein
MFTGSGERLRAEGIVLAWLAPDWRAGRTMQNIQSLSGKMKLMPLPPWEEGGLRTSVWGGTMFGFPRNNKNFDDAWKFGKALLFNRDVARSFWETLMIISPVVEFWDDPIYDQKMEFYSDQAIGRLLIEMAPDVPHRSSSVYYPLAVAEVANALNRLSREARTRGIRERELLHVMVAREMGIAQENVVRIVERNIFQDR